MLSLANRVVIKIIRFYQNYISAYRPPRCRFSPTCSEYAILAFSQCHSYKAIGLVIYRLLRCGPWCTGGYDPVIIAHKPRNKVGN